MGLSVPWYVRRGHRKLLCGDQQWNSGGSARALRTCAIGVGDGADGRRSPSERCLESSFAPMDEFVSFASARLTSYQVCEPICRMRSKRTVRHFFLRALSSG
jgi:hypothetical protein